MAIFSKGEKMNIEKEDFRQWLQSIHGDTIVGIPGSGTNCPIANFLNSRISGFTHVRGDNFCVYSYTTGAKLYPTPRWASKFVKKIDSDSIIKEITAQKALELL